MFTLSGLHIYPVKSLGGIALPAAAVQHRGLQYDRRWMLVDDQGVFVTQREIPALTGLGTALEPPFLVVFSKKNPALRVEIPLEPPVNDLQMLEVQVWDDRCPAAVLPKTVHQWFSDLLGYSLRLVYMPDSTQRPTDGRYAPAGQHVSFSDGFPFLLIGQASLDDLNGRLPHAVPMDRFRPNFIVSGSAPYEEDSWRDFVIGNVLFRGVKPCARCTMTTLDQHTGARGVEPLQTLATYRRAGQKVLFGQNVVWLGEQSSEIVRVGDMVAVRGRV